VKPWERSWNVISPGWGERMKRLWNNFLSLLPGLWIFTRQTHGCAVGYFLPPLRD